MSLRCSTRCFLALAILTIVALAARGEAKWEGVDDNVEKIAANHGHPATQPLINTDHGDLLLFLFLTAGATAGFIGGYVFRGLFPPKKISREERIGA